MESTYIEKGMELKKQYSTDCSRVKGTGKAIGHQKNYIIIGLYTALKAERAASSETKERLEELMGTKLRNKDNKIDVENAEKIAPMVGDCQVIKTKKKGFINLLMRGQEGLEVFQVLEQVLNRVGRRQWDP